MASRYQIVCMVVDRGSLKGAADELGYTQSAVSQAVKALERELGTTLIERGKQGVSLTRDGKQYLPYLRQIVTAEAELEGKRQELLGLSSTDIRIATFTNVSRTVLPRVIRDFGTLHPGVRFSILPLGETCAVSLYRPCQTPVEPAAFVQAEFLHAYRPQLECEKLYTFFYQESAHDFYFRGERHEPYEMVYVDKGKLHNVVNGQDHLLEQQDLMLIGSNDWHIQYADHPVSFLTLSFSTKNL